MCRYILNVFGPVMQFSFSNLSSAYRTHKSNPGPFTVDLFAYGVLWDFLSSTRRPIVGELIYYDPIISALPVPALFLHPISMLGLPGASKLFEFSGFRRNDVLGPFGDIDCFLIKLVDGYSGSSR